tara:strand:+ start:21 stop:203 length:183 start_codon:yes stop_codon:yes gene_type:complete
MEDSEETYRVDFIKDLKDLKDFEIIRTVDLALKKEEESIDDFIKRTIKEELGIIIKYSKK